MRVPLILLLLLPLTGYATDRLHGTWQSDHDQSMDFVRDHTVLEPRQSGFLNGTLGRLQLSFDGARMRYKMPDVDLTIEGNPSHLVGIDESYTYRVLGSDQDSIALKLEKDHGRDRIIHIHFVSDDVFWLYSEESDYGLRDLNFREYFRRVVKHMP
jgi:hypothetical protein